ncbi:MAG: hypothetical protein JKY99_12780 [Rhizobiales bacterium]|nr:hypothetical protein [Hyphomicrobiales bacterium]
MDEFGLERARAQQITIEKLGPAGARLLEEVRTCPVPLFQDNKIVAMVIKIEQFDQHWQFCEGIGRQHEAEYERLGQELLELIEKEAKTEIPGK